MATTRKLRVITKDEPEMAFGLIDPDLAAVRELTRTSTASFTDTLITPRLASILLRLNTANRPIRARQVEHYKKILQEGRWVNTGEPVIFSVDSSMNEGQHRLTSIEESGIPAPLDIRFGVPQEAKTVSGTGARRASSDVLGMNGFGAPISLSATLKLALAYQRGLPQNYNWRSDADLILKAAKHWPHAEEAQNLVLTRLKSRYFRNAACACFMFFVTRVAGIERAAELIGMLANHAAGAPIAFKLLHSRMTMDLALRLGRSEVVVEKLALYILAWNALQTGQKINKLAWDQSRPYPVMDGLKLD